MNFIGIMMIRGSNTVLTVHQATQKKKLTKDMGYNEVLKEMVYWSNKRMKWVAWKNMIPKFFDSWLEAIVYEDKFHEIKLTLNEHLQSR